jgi:putative hemolysin
LADGGGVEVGAGNGISAGRLSVRLARTQSDIRAAQALRYQVFCIERGAQPASVGDALDVDPYDQVCDHLLVAERQPDGGETIVGTYRLLLQSVAERHAGFYSSQEYDLTPLARAGTVGARGQMLELGRSCVAPGYRTTGTIALLWRGIADYLERNDVSLMFGCASFAGTDPDVHATALSYLAHHHAAPPELRVSAHPHHHVEMSRLPPGSYDSRLAARSLPPLIKGYLRVGAAIGDGAYVDHAFNTVDVFILMPVEQIAQRYSERFRRAA